MYYFTYFHVDISNYFLFAEHRLLVLSDSIAKYVKLRNGEVMAFRGANIGELTGQIKYHKGSISNFNQLIIHVGTNDIYNLTVDQFKSAYCNLISIVKSYFPHIKFGMSSILPRPVDFNDTNKKICSINQNLEALCMKYDVHFIHSHRRFLKFGKPLVELFAVRDGGLHLNFEGTRQLGLYFQRRAAHF